MEMVLSIFWTPITLVGKDINVNFSEFQYTFAAVVTDAPLPFGAVASAIIGFFLHKFGKFQSSKGRLASRP